jgi:hypothetical protein
MATKSTDKNIKHLTNIIEEQGKVLDLQKQQLMKQTIQLQELWTDQAQGTGKWKRKGEQDQTANMEKILELSKQNAGPTEALAECELEVEKMGEEMDRLKTLLADCGVPKKDLMKKDSMKKEAPSRMNENLQGELGIGDEAWGGRRKTRKTKRRKRRKTKRRKTKRHKRRKR